MSSTAIQLGIAACPKVIAIAGSSEKFVFCRDLGAHHTIDYRIEDLYNRVMEITKGGGAVDVVFDPVGVTATEASRRLLAW